MRFLLAGGSGFLGSAWSRWLTDHGHEVVALVRRPPDPSDPAPWSQAQWDPASGTVDPELVETADVVANLAGANLAHVPWTASYRREFLASRVDTTRTLAEAVARSERRPVLLAQSGIAGYGDRGSRIITEDTPIDATTFLADVVRQWESATAPAVQAGARVVLMRTSVVLDRHGGAMKSLLLPFRLGLGGRIGTGEQYFATISLHDWLGAATFLAQNDLDGPVNVTGPDTSTNAEFTAALGQALHRPTHVPVPGALVRAGSPLAGPVAGELLASQRVEPCRLLEAGYAFAHDHITTRVTAALR